MSRNDEVLMLKQKIQDLERKCEELDKFSQACLTKIGDQSRLLARAYTAIKGNADLADEIRRELR